LVIAAAISGVVNQVIATTFDGVTWALRNCAGHTGFNAIAISPTQGKALLLSSVINGALVQTEDGIAFTNLVNNLNTFAGQTWRWIVWSELAQLWVACSSGGGTGLDRIATSPTGEVWTQRATPVGGAWSFSKVNPYTGRIWVGNSNAVARPLIFSDDGINWTNVVGAVPVNSSALSLAFAQSGRMLVYSLGNNRSFYTDDSGVNWSDTGNLSIINGNSDCAAYRETNNLFVGAAAANGTYSANAGAMVWSIANGGADFTALFGMTYSKNFDRFIGIKSSAGLLTTQSQLGSAGWTSTAHGLGPAGDWRRIHAGSV
jgi:hypothetical protein